MTISDLVSSLKVPTLLIEGFTVNAIALVAICIAVVLAGLAVRAPGIRPKVAAVAAVPLLTATIAYAMVEQLSHPKELALWWLKAQGENGVSIHNTIVIPPKWVHLWMDVEGEPRHFFIPWSEDLEQSLRQARKEQEGRKGELRLRFEPSLEREPKFYSMPWPAPPPKDETPPANNPIVVERDA